MESDVRAAAGPPETLVTDLGRPTDPSAVGAACRAANATAAMLYTLDVHGWFGGRPGRTSGIDTVVVCLDARRIVVSTHMELLTF